MLVNNRHLQYFFENATPSFSQDLSIAQISFDNKTLVQDHIIMMGDAAGLIHPLCGNGMAMAIHSAKIASEAVIGHFKAGKFNRNKMEEDYRARWNKNFRSRLQAGRVLQRILLSPALASFSQHTVNLFPSLLPKFIKRTHGNPML